MFKEVEVIKNTRKKAEKLEDGVTERDLKKLEEGFIRTDDILDN